MNEVKASPHFSANLKFVPQTGEVFVQGDREAKLRLSPVNTRVLAVLIQDAGEAVSRQQIFDAVWPNQVVSDDALTRAISDLRAQLKPLADVSPLIGTIPKIGYRWLSSVSEAPTEALSSKTPDIAESVWVRQVLPMVSALVLLLLLLWAGVFALQWWYQPKGVSVIILPTEGSEQEVTAHIKQAMQSHENLNYLSQFAVKSHQGNPFPYFRQEFGVHWFIESHLGEEVDGYVKLTLNLVDAKTALVSHTRQYEINNEQQMITYCQQFVDFVAGLNDG